MSKVFKTQYYQIKIGELQCRPSVHPPHDARTGERGGFSGDAGMGLLCAQSMVLCTMGAVRRGCSWESERRKSGCIDKKDKSVC